MTIRVDVKVDDKNVLRRLRNLERRIKKNRVASVDDAGRFTRDMLKYYMPKNTGDSASSIRVLKHTNNKKESMLIVGQAFMPHPEKKWRGEWFNIPRYVKYGRISGMRFRTGSVRDFRNVPKETFKRFRNRIRFNLMKK